MMDWRREVWPGWDRWAVLVWGVWLACGLAGALFS